MTIGDSDDIVRFRVSQDYLDRVGEALRTAASGWYPGKDTRIQVADMVAAPQPAFAPVRDDDDRDSRKCRGFLKQVRRWWKFFNRLLWQTASQQDPPPHSPFRSWILLVDGRPREFLKVLLLGDEQWRQVLCREQMAFEWLESRVRALGDEGEGLFFRGIATGVGPRGVCGVQELHLELPAEEATGSVAHRHHYLRRPLLPWPKLSSFEPSSEAVEGVFEAVLHQVEAAFGITSREVREENRRRLLNHVRESVLICAPPWVVRRREITSEGAGSAKGRWEFPTPDRERFLDLPSSDKGFLPILFVLEPAQTSPGRIQRWCDGSSPDAASGKIERAFRELKVQMTGSGPDAGPDYTYLIGWLPSTWRFEWKELWS